jgi:fumarylpyruvate hydrolase
MIHDVPAILCDLSRFYALGPGDVILTGTPAGVGAVGPGDRIEGTIDGLEPVRLTIAAG